MGIRNSHPISYSSQDVPAVGLSSFSNISTGPAFSSIQNELAALVEEQLPPIPDAYPKYKRTKKAIPISHSPPMNTKNKAYSSSHPYNTSSLRRYCNRKTDAYMLINEVALNRCKIYLAFFPNPKKKTPLFPQNMKKKQ